jgi:hypothetical protein
MVSAERSRVSAFFLQKSAGCGKKAYLLQSEKEAEMAEKKRIAENIVIPENIKLSQMCKIEPKNVKLTGVKMPEGVAYLIRVGRNSRFNNYINLELHIISKGKVKTIRILGMLTVQQLPQNVLVPFRLLCDFKNSSFRSDMMSIAAFAIARTAKIEFCKLKEPIAYETEYYCKFSVGSFSWASRIGPSYFLES